MQNEAASGPPSVVAGGGLHADQRALVELRERRGAGVRAGGADARSRSRRRGPRRRGGPGRGTSARRRCPPRTAPCGPARKPTGRGAVGDRARRGHAEGLLVRRPSVSRIRSPGDSWVPANQEPTITADAPAARARATSRGCRTPPSAQTCRRARAAAAAHSSTAENCGRPTPVIIRVVHMAPGPTPTLTMSAPASTRSRVPSAVTTLPATTGTCGSSAADGGQRLEHPVLVAVRGVDDEAVGAGVEQLPGLVRDVAVDADRGGDPQAAVGVDGGVVERGAQRAGAGEHADQPPVAVDDRRRPAACAASSASKRPAGRRRRGASPSTGRITSGPGRTGRPRAVALGHDARSAGRPRRPRPRRGHAWRSAPAPRRRSGPGQRDRGVEDEVAALTRDTSRPPDRDVLRDDGDPAAPGDGLGHPPSGDRGHVGDDERDRRPGAVVGGEVDVGRLRPRSAGTMKTSL